jgi:hypothetical protein
MYKQIATFFALVASAMAFVPEPVAKGKFWKHVRHRGVD